MSYKKKLEELYEIEKNLSDKPVEEVEKIIPILKKKAAKNTSFGLILFVAAMIALFTIPWQNGF